MTVGPVWIGGSIRCEWVPQARGLPRDWLPSSHSETWAEHEHFLGRVSAQRHNVEGSHLPRISLSYPSSHSGGTCFPLQTALRQQRVRCSHFCKIPKSRLTKCARELLTWGGFRVSVVGFTAILQCLFRPSSKVRKEMDGALRCTGRETPSVPGRQLSDGENQIFHLHVTLASNS